MVPFIIHQIYWNFTENPLELIKIKEIPNDWKIMSNNTRNTYSNWEYKLWGYQDCVDLIKENYSNLLDFWLSLSNIEKCDLVRFMILYKYGGYYIDMDIEIVNKCLENWKDHDIVLYNVENYDIYSLNNMYIISNCLMGVVKNHPFCLECINYTVKWRNRLFYVPYFIRVLLMGPINVQYNYYKNSKRYNIFVIAKPSICIKHEKKNTWRTKKHKTLEIFIFLLLLILVLIFLYIK